MYKYIKLRESDTKTHLHCKKCKKKKTLLRLTRNDTRINLDLWKRIENLNIIVNT